MSEDLFLQILQQSVIIAAKLVGPLLIFSTIVGLSVSLFQTVTQLNEMTLTFIPKIVVTGLVLIILGPWMLEVIMDYAREMILDIPNIIH